MSVLLAVDGDSLAHRAYHALPKSIRLNAVVGFTNMLVRLWQAEQPDAVLVAWDTLSVPTYRHEAFEPYQSGRVFEESLEALAPFGRLVTYGLASRRPSDLSNATLLRSSRGVVGFWLMHCLERPGMLGDPLRDLLDRAAGGELRTVAGGTYPLSQARRAHEDIQSRRTSGKLVIDPSA